MPYTWRIRTITLKDISVRVLLVGVYCRRCTNTNIGSHRYVSITEQTQEGGRQTR